MTRSTFLLTALLSLTSTTALASNRVGDADNDGAATPADAALVQSY